MMTPDFLLDEEMTLMPFVRQGADRPIYGEQQIIKGRMSLKRMSYRENGVEEIIVTGKLMLPYEIQPTIDSMIRYKGIAYFVVSVVPITGFGGCYTEVLVR